jgi:hypothetical protein
MFLCYYILLYIPKFTVGMILTPDSIEKVGNPRLTLLEDADNDL